MSTRDYRSRAQREREAGLQVMEIGKCEDGCCEHFPNERCPENCTNDLSITKEEALEMIDEEGRQVCYRGRRYVGAYIDSREP